MNSENLPVWFVDGITSQYGKTPQLDFHGEKNRTHEGMSLAENELPMVIEAGVYRNYVFQNLMLNALTRPEDDIYLMEMVEETLSCVPESEAILIDYDNDDGFSITTFDATVMFQDIEFKHITEWEL